MKRHVVVAAMRNEGPFILEWVAWQKMLGFDDVLILYNDCTDHSPQLLRRLDSAGWVTTQEHSPPPGKTPKWWAHMKARGHDLVERADWMFLCDVDEFLVLRVGDGTLPAFLGDDEPDVAGIAINWRVFGDAGHARWQDGLVHRTYTRAARSGDRANIFFKSFVYRPARFKVLSEHSPKHWLGNKDWGVAPNVWALSNGQEFAAFDPGRRPPRSTPRKLITHANAQLNHYMIRARECFEFKRGRPAASSFVDRYSDAFLERNNRNEVEDLSALAYADRFDRVHAEICAVPDVMRLHHLCCADYVAEMCRSRGENPEDDPRVAHHRDEAERHR